MIFVKRCEGCKERCEINLFRGYDNVGAYFPKIGDRVITEYVDELNEHHKITYLWYNYTSCHKSYEVELSSNAQGKIKYYGSEISAFMAGQKIAKLCDKYGSDNAGTLPEGFFQGKRINNMFCKGCNEKCRIKVKKKFSFLKSFYNPVIAGKLIRSYRDENGIKRSAQRESLKAAMKLMKKIVNSCKGKKASNTR